MRLQHYTGSLGDFLGNLDRPGSQYLDLTGTLAVRDGPGRHRDRRRHQRREGRRQLLPPHEGARQDATCARVSLAQSGMRPFANFDLSSFWKTSDYATQQYVDLPCTPESVAAVEAELGFKLPLAYVALAAFQNGGMPWHTAHRTTARTSWAADHIAISGIFSIGSNKPYSLCGELGSRFHIEE